MSFITDGIRDVFRGVRKVVRKAWDNKWVRTGLIIGGSLLTAGLLGGGWAAFGGLMKAGGGGIGGFFSAVGKTMASGWGQIQTWANQAWNWGKKAVGGLFGGGQQQPTGPSVSTTSISGGGIMGGAPGAGGTAPTGGGTQQQGGPGGGGWFKNMFNWMFGGTTGAAFVRGAIGAGAEIYLADKQWEREREYKDQATVRGTRAFGGDGTSALQPVQFSDVDAREETAPFSRQARYGGRQSAASQSPSEFARSQMVQNNRATPILQGPPRLMPANGGVLGG